MSDDDQSAQCYMPFPDGGPETPLKVRAVLMVTIPADIFPNPSTGLFKDCVRTPESVLLLNGALFVIEVAHHANAHVYFEQVVDYELWRRVPSLKKTHALRVIIPMNSHQLSAFSMQAATATARTITSETTQSINGAPRAAKRQKLEGARSAAPYSLTNTMLGHQYIDSEATFARYHATSKGCSHRVSGINFRLVSDNDEGELGDDLDDGAAPLSDLLPPNNIACLLELGAQFKTDYVGAHPDQVDPAMYINADGYFQFPDSVRELKLVTTVPPLAPFLGGNVDGLLHLALPGATTEMSREELINKIQTLRSLSGQSAPNMTRWPYDDIVSELFIESGSGDDVVLSDPTIYSPIQVQPNLARRVWPDLCTEPELIMSKLYKEDSMYRLSFTSEFRYIARAVSDGTLSQSDGQQYIRDIEKRIHSIYKGTPKAGMPASYFAVESQTQDIIATLSDDAERGECIALRACEIINSHTDTSMSYADYILCTKSSLLVNEMHKTPAQACFVLFGWVLTFTTFIPTIQESQPWIILMGSSDTGKSDAMNCLSQALPGTAVVREDSASKLAVVENSDVGLKICDEQGWGTVDNKEKNTLHLTAQSHGYMTYKRLVLDPNGSGKSKNIKIISDQRSTMISASNSSLFANMRSRAIPIYLTGHSKTGSRSRSEMATLDDKTDAGNQAAVMAFRYLWSLHFRWHLYYSNVRFHLNRSLYPLFYGIAKKTIRKWKLEEPQCREVMNISRIALGCMIFRVTMEYRSQSEHDVTFMEYVRGNSLIKMMDYVCGMAMILRNQDIADEDNIVKLAMKNAVITRDDQFVMHDQKWAVTSLQSETEIASRCAKFGNNAGVVSDVLSRLGGPESDDDGPIVSRVNRGPDQGMYCIMLKHLTTPSVRTPAELAILEFLRNEVIPYEPKLWRVSYDEDTIVFNTAVLGRILEPHNATVFNVSPALRKVGASIEGLDTAMRYLEAAGDIIYRDSSNSTGNLDGDGALVSASVPGVSEMVHKAGLLDEMRVYGDDYMYSPDDEWEKVPLCKTALRAAQVRNQQYEKDCETIKKLSDSDESAANDIANINNRIGQYDAEELSREEDSHRRAEDHNNALTAKMESAMTNFGNYDRSRPQVMPVLRRHKTRIRLFNVLMVKKSLLKDVIDNELCKHLNIPPHSISQPEILEEETDLGEQIRELADICAGVSGERKPGDKIFLGINPHSTAPCEIHTIREVTGTFTIDNPRRSDRHLFGDDRESWDEQLLPSSQSVCTFGTSDSTLTKDALRHVAEVNCV